MPLSKIQGINGQVTPNLGRRNIVINGAMQVAQRKTSQASIGGNTNYWTVDRYKLFAPNTNGRLTMSQDTDTPNGFGNSIKFDCTTADTSIAANEYMLLQQSFEGRDVQRLKKGTSEAEQITVSFYMKTNKAFTFMCELNDSDNNRVNTQQFTTSTSWTRHILTFAADTTGALDNDNALSFGVGIWMHGGSNFTGGTYSANTWQSRAASDNMRAVGIGSFFDNTDNLVRITGLQMEVGNEATEFEHRSFQEELTLCERYFFMTYNYGATIGAASGASYLIRFIDNSHNYGSLQVPSVQMRSSPTRVIYNTSTGTAGELRSDTANHAAQITATDIHGGGCIYANNSQITTSQTIKAHLTMDAEL